MTTAIRETPTRNDSVPLSGPSIDTEVHGLPVYDKKRTALLWGVSAFAAILMLVAFGMAWFYAGTDVTQGNVQRLFYVHVASFSASFIALFTTVIAGLLYLMTRHYRWDRLAVAGVQVGLTLSTITLITGAIWARPTWNTWWTRDPRLDSMIVMWSIYAAYLVLRSAIHAPDQRARFSAVFGMLAFVSVIYVTIIIRIRPNETLHPVVIAPQLSRLVSGEALTKGLFSLNTDPRQGFTLGVASIAWSVAAGVLMWHLVRVANLADRVRAIKLRIAENER